MEFLKDLWCFLTGRLTKREWMLLQYDNPRVYKQYCRGLISEKEVKKLMYLPVNGLAS